MPCCHLICPSAADWAGTGAKERSRRGIFTSWSFVGEMQTEYAVYGRELATYVRRGGGSKELSCIITAVAEQTHQPL